MGNLLNLITKVNDLPIEQIAEDSLKKITPEIIDAQKKQMSEGQDSLSGKIHWQDDSHYPYTKQYARIKRNLGGQTDRVDLKLRGDFYNKVEAKVQNGQLIITSSDIKAGYLEKHYGRDLIYGLNKDSRGSVIREFLRPATFQTVREHLNLK